MGFSSGFLLGDYEVVAPIGVGGMGEVYRAHDRRLEREVAIKVLRDLASSGADSLRRFEQEARAAAALNHPNILAVYQMGQFEGVPYLVSELLEGETLREKIRRGALPLRQVIDIGGQIARGLSAAHRKGIVHRDLKPENLFLSSNGHVKILDFGLARLVAPEHSAGHLTRSLEAGTSPGVVLGTVGYMSPEQVRGEPVDARSDIFSFTTILREMLTGEPTFRKATAAETMTAILNEEPAPVTAALPGVPPGLQRVLDRGLEKNPDLRFQSAADLAFALETMSDPALARSVHRHETEKSQRPHRLRPAIAALAVALAMAGIAAWLALRPPRPPRVSNYVALTHDGVQKNLLGTDGNRLYLTEFSAGLVDISAIQIPSGARTSLSMPWSDTAPIHLSPDGSEFLIVHGSGIPFTGTLWSLPVLGGSPRRLGETEGSSGAWSPDHKWLAFTNRGDLSIARADGSEPRRIAGPATVGNTVWSPDSSILRFDSSQGLGPAVGQHMLWEVAADGSGLQRLLENWHNPPDECCGRWSASGKYFLFQSRGQIWALPRPGRWLHRHPAPLPLTSSPMALSSPVPSTDGKKLFLVGATYRGELSRYDGRSRQFVPFLDGISAEYVTFSKDGQWMAYVTYPEGNLWRSRVDGSERMQLTFPPGRAVLPRWSPDGSVIVYFLWPQSSAQAGHIFRIAAGGGTPEELLPGDPRNEQDPNWSPDGKKIVFGGDVNRAMTHPHDPGIRIYDTRTHAVTTVVGSEGLFSPRWSADGKSLAALGGDSRSLHLFDLVTQKWRVVTRGSLGWLNWSKDGQWMYMLDFSGRGAVIRVRLADGFTETVTDLKDFVTTGAFGGMLTLTPDDEPLLLRDRGTQDIYALDWDES